MKIAIILGTRPEIIKMSPVIRACKLKKIDYYILHTGQHYSYRLDKIFFNELELDSIKYNLNVGSGSHAEEVGNMLMGIESNLKVNKPDIVLIQGDTNTVVSAALATCKLDVKLGHIEAGLRSYDRTMPEEINRVIADHCSDLLFSPTDNARRNLLKEGIDKNKIFVTGNTIVDAVCQNLEISKSKINVLRKINVKMKKYFLVTAHRQENVDNKKKLKEIINALVLIKNEFNYPIIYPIHYRTLRRIKEYDLALPKCLDFIEPLGYLDFLQLAANAHVILTDSGGIQEEACILRVPCITLRENTERPETLEVGSNIIVGTNPENILAGVQIMISKSRNWKNPYGDGTASQRILNYLKIAYD